MPDDKYKKKEQRSDLPKVDPPKNWSFAPDPFVVGPPDLAREVWNFTNKYPDVKNRLKMVTQGPTIGSMREMADFSNFGPSYFGDSNPYLAGIYASKEKDIGINPTINSRLSGGLRLDRSQTLGHELGHALGGKYGYMLEPEAKVFGNKWQEYYKANPDKRDKAKKLNLGPRVK